MQAAHRRDHLDHRLLIGVAVIDRPQDRLHLCPAGSDKDLQFHTSNLNRSIAGPVDPTGTGAKLLDAGRRGICDLIIVPPGERGCGQNRIQHCLAIGLGHLHQQPCSGLGGVARQ